MSCATSSGQTRSNQKPQVASKATLDRLRAQRDALKKEVKAMKKSTAKTTRKVSTALGKITMSGSGKELLAREDVQAAYLEGGRH